MTVPDAAGNIMNTIFTYFTIDVVVQTFTQIIPYALPFVFFWWAARRVIRMSMSAVRKGRLSI